MLEEKLPQEHRDAISAVMDEYVSAGHSPGMVVVIADRDHILFQKAIGLRRLQPPEPMTTDTIFHLASMGKPFTAVAILKLYEQGLLDLDQPVSQIVPELADRLVHQPAGRALSPADREISVHDLLTHIAGFSYGVVPIAGDEVSGLYAEKAVIGHRVVGRQSPQSATLADMIDRLASLPLAYQPGTSWQYSLASDVLAHIVELLSGQKFDEWMREHLFAPLGMHDTHFSVPAHIAQRVAELYDLLDEKLSATGLASTFAEPLSFLGGGGEVLSTANDYLRFCRMLLNGGILDGQRILETVSVRRMTHNHLTAEQQQALNAVMGPSIGPHYGFGYSVTVAMRDDRDYGARAGDFFWPGASGVRSWISPATGLVGIVMNHVRFVELGIDKEIKKIIARERMSDQIVNASG